MENNNKNHVNIYYTEDEVHDAFRNYYNDVKQYSKVYIFTKNALPLSLYGEENNVELHSTGGFWDKLKAWMAGETQFKHQFSQLNISEENQERYRLIIKNGGTIIFSEQDDSDNDNGSIETLDVDSLETEDASLPLSISNIREQLDENNERQNLEQTINFGTQITHSENSTLDQNTQNHSGNELTEQDDQIIDPASFNEFTEPNATNQNLFIADVNSTNRINFEQEEYYENGPRKHNLYSENLKQLSSENEQNVQPEVDSPSNTIDEPTNRVSFPHVPDKAIEHPGEILSHLNTYDTLKENMPESEHQLENLAQLEQQYDSIDNQEPQKSMATSDFTQQLPHNSSVSMADLLSSLNIPTDSTESVLDLDLQSILKQQNYSEVRNPFQFKSLDENEPTNFSVEDDQHRAEELQENDLKNKLTTENPLSDVPDVNNGPEQK